jgi:hypothetical protein
MQREHLWIHHEQDATRYWKVAEGGYPGRMSVKQGESIDFHISSSRAQYDIRIVREGARREPVATIDNLRGELHPVPETGYRDGFAWPVAATLDIPLDWRSGIYIAEFPTGQGIREILFVVRPREPRSPILLTLATNTYAAYNNVGGKSLYDYISTDRLRADQVSFERPLQPNVMGNFYFWDQFFLSWLDAEEFEVDYGINADLDAEPELLAAYRANLRICHDEYNTRNECELLQQFVRNGGNLLLFAGNCFFHDVEYRNDFRSMHCRKPHPNNPPTAENPDTDFWPYIDNMRQRTIGLMYTSFVHAKTDKPDVFCAQVEDGGKYGYFRVTDPDHWIYEGTGLNAGDEFGREDSIVGVEADAANIEFVDGKPVFTGVDGVSKDYRILALADARIVNDCFLRIDGAGTGGEADAYGVVSINETEFAGSVFNAATIEWGHGLHREDSPVPTITRNVLKKLGT